MFAIPGILFLIAVVYLRPQEIYPPLQAVPLLYLGLALALFGIAVDWRLRRGRPLATPPLGWAILFVGWALFTLLVRSRSDLASGAIQLGTSFALFLVIAHGVQSLRALRAVAGFLLGITLLLSLIGVHQGFAPLGCHRQGAGEELVYDGRPCQTARECQRGDAEPGADYACERVGLFGSSSVGQGRVRWVGPLQDPNELALAVAIGLPFAFAAFERKRSAGRLALLLGSLVLIAACVILTRSRGGQLVFLAVLAVYFVRRFGWRGLVLGAILSAPILLLGGRSGAEAESSSLERLDCWFEGMSMVKGDPLVGVGQGQFAEHHVQTAHNSYILAAAELGLPGMLLWSLVLWAAGKVPVQALRRLRDRPGAQAAVTWSVALLASLAGLAVGIFFLSFCYHPVLWIYLGLCGALYGAVRAHDPDFTVSIGLRDLAAVAAIDAALLAILYLYTRVAAAP